MRKTRRKRNRKQRVDGYMFPVPLATLLVFAAVAALAYLWILSRCEIIGNEIKQLEAEQAVLIEKVLNEDLKWTRLRSPQNLERILARNGVRMGWPSQRQVVVLARSTWQGLGEGDVAMISENRYAGVSRTMQHE